MIDVKELRIGNCVLNTFTGENALVKSIDENGINKNHVVDDFGDDTFFSWLAFDRIAGIPLTPAILGKCEDFSRCVIEEEDSFFNGDNALIRVADMSYFIHSELDGSVMLARYRIKHLHQLQNLYFALTGTELTFNPYTI